MPEYSYTKEALLTLYDNVQHTRMACELIVVALCVVILLLFIILYRKPQP